MRIMMICSLLAEHSERIGSCAAAAIVFANFFQFLTLTNVFWLDSWYPHLSKWVELKRLWKNKRQTAMQALNLAMVILSALIIWKGLVSWTNSESPVVVVLSGSMEPAFQRGDILFLNNSTAPLTVGEVVVFKIRDR